jgi:hypothetical protein
VQGSAGELTGPSVGARVVGDVVALCLVGRVCVCFGVVIVSTVLATGRGFGFAVTV